MTTARRPSPFLCGWCNGPQPHPRCRGTYGNDRHRVACSCPCWTPALLPELERRPRSSTRPATVAATELLDAQALELPFELELEEDRSPYRSCAGAGQAPAGPLELRGGRGPDRGPCSSCGARVITNADGTIAEHSDRARLEELAR